MKRAVLFILALMLVFCLFNGCVSQTNMPELSEQPMRQTPVPTPEPTQQDDSINDIGSEFQYENNGDGTCSITRYKGEKSGDLIIPGKINGLTVIGLRWHPFWDDIGLTSITIHEDVTTIEADTFYGCNNLASIEVSEQNRVYSSMDGVLFNKDKSTLIKAPKGMKKENYEIPSSVKIIGDFAFENCVGLTGNLTIPDNVTMIGIRAFQDCNGFTGSLAIPDSVTKVGWGAFDGCDGLTSITRPSKQTPEISSKDYDVTKLAGKKVSEIIGIFGDGYTITKLQKRITDEEGNEIETVELDEYEEYSYSFHPIYDTSDLSFVKLKTDKYPLYINISGCENIKGLGLCLSDTDDWAGTFTFDSEDKIEKLLGKPDYSYNSLVSQIHDEWNDSIPTWGYKLKSKMYLEFEIYGDGELYIGAAFIKPKDMYINPNGIPGEREPEDSIIFTKKGYINTPSGYFKR